jgi:hypothetical protein
MKTLKLVRGSMNSDIKESREPSPELVECAIVEVLAIAQCQGITPADFIQLLDSGIRMSDFLAALKPLAKAKDRIGCDS